MPVKRPSGTIEATTQLYLKVAEVHDDCLVLKDGGLRAILEVGSVNFSLKNEDEQMAIVGAYQEFLNVLDFPIQILLRSHRLDVDGYLERMQRIARKQSDPLMRDQTINYIFFIRSLVQHQDIMAKKFYVVVPLDPARSKGGFASSFMSQLNPADTLLDARIRAREFDTQSKGLASRVNVVAGALSRCDVQVTRLGTEQLIELLYTFYNPATSEVQKLHSLELAAQQQKKETSMKSTYPDLDIAREEDLRLASIQPSTALPGAQAASRS